LEPLSTIPEWITLEHDVARILTEQELHGWFFNEPAAWQLAQTLYTELSDLNQLLRNRYPYVAGAEFTPKRPNRTQGYVTGATFTRLKEFNPTSRDHIAWVMKTRYNRNFEKMTATGKPVINETTLKDIGTEEALQFFRSLELTKQLGMLSEGDNAWLKMVRNNRIHHNCSVSTNTFRCAHRNPNLAQVPSDLNFRKLFTATPGQVMVGADLAGIELRMLAHYLARYDGGRYGDVLLNGDIHQENADKIGISRRLVKTVTYAFLYGAGDIKIGLSYDPQLPSQAAKKKGTEIRASLHGMQFLDLRTLVTAVKSKAESGYINLCDGRRCAVDGSHKALNYLLQGSAGIVAKRWMVINHDNTRELCCSQLAFIHDELQFECDQGHVEKLRTSLVRSAEKAGEYYNLRIKIEAEAQQGNNWSEVH
jgi:DNA polymerase I-like protein with 3'-5' exonuclease and polymerase domains